MSLHHRARSLIRVGVASIVGLVVFSGCSDSSGPSGDCDVPALFAQRCGSAACHEGSSPSADLDLVSAGLEDRVANAEGSQCTGKLADPSDPEGSLMYDKVAEAVPSCGARMPLGQQPLTAEEITCVRDWISGLLPPQPDPVDAGPDCPECECEPNEVESCYSGPAGTADVGICQSGMRTCAPDGLSWGPCEGEVLPRGEDCYTTDIDENCDGQTPECSDLWSQGFSTPDSQSMRSVAVDSQGNVIALGDFVGTLSFGGDPLTASGLKADIVLVKLDRYGNHIWSYRYGDSSNQYATQVTVDANDNIIIIGRAFGTIDFGGLVLDGAGSDDVFVAKFDSDGGHVWSRIFGGLDPDRAERVTTDANGDVLVTGTFTGTVDLGSGPWDSNGERDAFVLKLASDTGAHVFSRRIGGTGDDYGFGIGADPQNNVFITGRFESSIDVGGTMLTSAGGSDIYVAKLDSLGNYQWAKSYGSLGADGPYDLAMDPTSDGFAITGYVSGNVNFGGGQLNGFGSKDIFLAEFDNDGNHVLSQLYGDSNDQFESDFDVNTWSALAIDLNGNMYLGGPLAYTADFGGQSLTSAGKPDAYFVKLRDDGSYVFGNRFGGVGTEIALDIAVDPTGQYVVLAGRFFGSSLDFGVSGSIAGEPGSDGFLVRFAPP